MTARPWSKFYWPDWRADPALRICSIAARGLWMEMLCLMNEAEPRGTLILNGKPIGVSQLANLAGGITPEATQGLLDELGDAGVFSRDEDGTIYSRRMRREKQISDDAREHGKSGGNPALKKQTNNGAGNPPLGDGVNPQSMPQEAMSHEAISQDSSLGGAGRYRWAGSVIRLNERDYEAWRKAYPSIADFDAELQRIDDDFRAQGPPKGWFSAASAKLNAKHQANLKAGKHGKRGQHPSGFNQPFMAAHAEGTGDDRGT